MSLTTYKRARRILVVDECKERLLSMQSILASQGYEIILTQNGESALTELTKTKIDLVILNVTNFNLQQQQGCEVNIWEITRALRTNAQCQIPILGLISDRNLELQFDAALAIDAWLYTPFEIEELLLQISLLLGSQLQAVTIGQTKNTFFVRVGEQDPLHQQRIELEKVLANNHPEDFWEKLLADGYEIRNEREFLRVN